MGEAAEVILTGDAVVGEVIDGKFFYKDDAEVKLEGTIPTVAIVAANDNYPAGYHVGNVGGLDAIDTDLASGNIKKDVVIFGKTGTLKNSLAEDTLADASTATTGNTSSGYYGFVNISLDDDITLATVTPTFDASSLAVAIGFAAGLAGVADRIKLRLYMGGVQVTESGYVSNSYANNIISGTRALSGAQVCHLTMYCYHALGSHLKGYTTLNTTVLPWSIGVGSVKLV